MKSIETYYLNKILKVLQEGYNHALLKEAVPYSIVKDYLKIKRSPEVESLLLSVFSKLKSLPNAIQLDKKGYRIAFPFNMKGGEVQDKSPIESEIDSLIQKHGFKVKDYFKGLAFDEKNKRDIKIGKVLSIVSKKDKEAQNLLNKFNTDTKRTQTKSSDEKLIVFSYHPYDIAGMSAGRDWTSCMNVIQGSNRHYVKVDIEKGTCIAYIIDKEDTNIQKPLARILIKPYLNVEDEKDTLLYPEEQVYGQIPNKEKFVSFVDDTMEKVQKMSGTYERLGCLYSDSDRDIIQDKEATLKIAKEKLESNQRLNYREYELLPDSVKQFYIEKIVEAGKELSEPQYEASPDNLKQLYIEKRVKAGKELSEPQYEASPDSIKQFYIKKIAEAGRYLSNPQYSDAPNDLKQLYIEKRVKAGGGISDPKYEVSSDSIKQFYIEKIVEAGKELSEPQYEASPDSIKQFYIKKIAEAGLYLPNLQYEDAPDNLKQLYIEKRVKANGYLSNPQYEDAPDNLKQLYIEKRVEAGGGLSDSQYKATPDNLKQYYFKLLKDNEREVPEYYSYYNDYQEYLKNNP